MIGGRRTWVRAISIRITFEDEDALVDVSDVENLQLAVEVPVSLALLEILSRVSVEDVSIEDADLVGEEGEPRIHSLSLRRSRTRGA
jgi:hypothetical protein